MIIDGQVKGIEEGQFTLKKTGELVKVQRLKVWDKTAELLLCEMRKDGDHGCVVDEQVTLVVQSYKKRPFDGAVIFNVRLVQSGVPAGAPAAAAPQRLPRTA